MNIGLVHCRLVCHRQYGKAYMIDLILACAVLPFNREIYMIATEELTTHDNKSLQAMLTVSLTSLENLC